MGEVVKTINLEAREIDSTCPVSNKQPYVAKRCKSSGQFITNKARQTGRPWGVALSVLFISLLGALFAPSNPPTLVSPYPVRANEKLQELPVLVDKPLSAVVKTAKITAYTCDSTMSAAQKAMNCPNGITATGTTPRAYKTAACPRKYLYQKFEIEGIGEVVCEDVGGAIRGEDRFDVFVPTYSEAMQFGVQYKKYRKVN